MQDHWLVKLVLLPIKTFQNKKWWLNNGYGVIYSDPDKARFIANCNQIVITFDLSFKMLLI
jgi:hypothetical protein